MGTLGAAFDVEAFLAGLPLRAAHWRIVCISTLIVFIDGFDVFVLGKVAPAVAAGFHMPAAAMTTVFLLQQVGLAAGAFAASPLADRFGRQRMIVISAAVFAVGTLISPYARSLRELGMLRGVAGFFLSGLLPMTIALIAETTPRCRSGLLIGVALAGYSSGSAAGGVVAAWLIDLWGWQSTFWIGGGLPLLALPALLVLLPESPQYLAGRRAAPARITAAVQRIEPGFTPPVNVAYTVGSRSRQSRMPVRAIFGPQQRRTTVVLWSVTFLSMGSIAMLAAWLPSFFKEMQGVPIQRFAAFAMLGYPGSLLGTLASGWLIDRVGLKLIPGVYLGLALSVAALSQASFGGPGFILIILAFNFCQSGGQALLNVLLARVYPVNIRTTGMGWAGGMGRVGGIVAPLFGGYALAAHLSFVTTLCLASVWPLAVALILFRYPVRPP